MDVNQNIKGMFHPINVMALKSGQVFEAPSPTAFTTNLLSYQANRLTNTDINGHYNVVETRAVQLNAIAKQS